MDVFQSKSLDTMAFAEFVEAIQEIIRDKPDVKRLCETRVGLAFKELRPGLSPPDHFDPICNEQVIEAWRRARCLPVEFARRTFLCDGVRHALKLLFIAAARNRRIVALPTDVYPAYLDIARCVGVDTVVFKTFPDFDVEAALNYSARAAIEIVVLPAPLVLHGRDWTESEAACAAAWLRANPQRRLYLDGVYSFGLPVDACTKTLLETDQVIYVDSLSKGWASQSTLGFACLPQRDVMTCADIFAQGDISQASLFAARRLLCDFSEFPRRINDELETRRLELARMLRQLALHILPSIRGYFICIEKPASSLLDRHNLLTIPASVFGCRSPYWSIASVLPAA